MSYFKRLEAKAIEIAADCGRDWLDCGEHERETFRDAARKELEG